MAPHIIAGSSPRKQQGIAYLAVLLLAMLMALFASNTYEQQSTIQQRQREQAWLFIGKQYQQAIKSYIKSAPDGIQTPPSSLQELLKDSRYVSTKRHLRKLYLDPLTHAPWELIYDDSEHIIGVRSSSKATILLKAETQKMTQALSANSDAVLEHHDVIFAVTEKPSSEAPSSEGGQAESEAIDGSGL